MTGRQMTVPEMTRRDITIRGEHFDQRHRDAKNQPQSPMACVFIPAPWRDLTDGALEAQIDGASLADIVAGLEARFPGLAERLIEQGTIAAGLAVSIDGAVTSRGLLAPVGPQSEIHFLPAIGGG